MRINLEWPPSRMQIAAVALAGTMLVFGAVFLGCSVVCATGVVLAFTMFVFRRKRKAPGSMPEAFDGVDLKRMPAADFIKTVRSITESEEGIKRALAFKPFAGDVLTFTSRKTGQTWLLAMLRKLSLGKGGGFDDTALAESTLKGAGIPWLEHPKTSVEFLNDQQAIIHEPHHMVPVSP